VKVLQPRIVVGDPFAQAVDEVQDVLRSVIEVLRVDGLLERSQFPGQVVAAPGNLHEQVVVLDKAY